MYEKLINKKSFGLPLGPDSCHALVVFLDLTSIDEYPSLAMVQRRSRLHEKMTKEWIKISCFLIKSPLRAATLIVSEHWTVASLLYAYC